MQIYILDNRPEVAISFKKYFKPILNEVPVKFVTDDFAHFMDEHETIDAVVSPANAYGLMDGGYDNAITRYFGNNLQKRVQGTIIKKWYGEQPVGTSITVPILERLIEKDDRNMYAVLIHTPTMRTPSRIVDPTIIYQCMRTTLIEVINNNCEHIVIPAFGGATGGLSSDIVAKMMYQAYIQIFDEDERQNIDWGVALDRRVKLNEIIRES